MILSVVMPSIAGREADLARSIEAYERLTPVPIEWIMELDHPNCGAAWNAGVPKATGEILHMGADDIEPETNAWFPAAMHALDRGFIPLGWVREDVIGTFGRDFARVVICRREWWQPVVETTYYSDNHFDDLMRGAGHPPVPVVGFDFYHRRSMIGRDDSPERVNHDRELYEHAMSGPDQLS